LRHAAACADNAAQEARRSLELQTPYIRLFKGG
jgi:hypothetical protein